MNYLAKLPQNIKEYIEQDKEELLEGYIRFHNEEEIDSILSIINQSNMWNGGIPFATTAFGDVFVWQDGFIVLYKFTEADYNVILSGSTFFYENVNDLDYQKEFFDIALYREAVNRFGSINRKECFSLEPIPALGGAREIKYVQIAEMKAYLSLVIQF